MKVISEYPLRRFNGNHSFVTDGYQIFPEALPLEECDALACELTALFQQQQNVSRKRIGGIRNVLSSSPRAAAIAGSSKLVSLAGRLAGRKAFPVKAIFFDKTSKANWSVPWHQDLAIAVAERLETQGFGPWSVKDNIAHVQPPRQILEGMVVLRLQLDEGSADNGALKVTPGSHLQGELGMDEIDDWVRRQKPVICEVAKGGALAMRPLLLHASSPAKEPSHRRVLHIEYASDELPGGLTWFERP